MSNKVEINPQIISEHGFSDEEYQQILSILGRTPTWVELGIFSVMWSEHASYKNSVKLLKTLPKDGPAMLTKAGEENAGIVDIGDNLAICFKIESHNHPSALEPYHGAATGVGGILRDIFTMGAKPIAALNSLRFGNPNDPEVKHLISEVVHGIADYGNCFGVPTVGGEVYFEDSYTGNPLVNAMAVGIVPHDKIARSAATGIGNLVLYVGAKTGRDGIHGATFASIELSEDSEEKRTAVQVGDPFLEKLLLEATLEVIHKDLVVGIQDMGAAGLTCSSSEMSGKAGLGIELEIDRVPQRESGMTAYEIMLSESQERMLLIVEPSNIDEVMEVFQRWDLDASVVGKVTADGILRVIWHGETVAEIPSEYLVLGGKAPVYEREALRPPWLDDLQDFDPFSIPEPDSYTDCLLGLLGSHNIASKHAIYRQYDHMVQINSHVEPGSDAAVITIKGTTKAIALSTDCNGRYCYLDPYEGARIAVAESARNVVCSGAKPLAITNCLNFGNPYKPEVFWTLKEAVRGIGEACKAFETPVTGGNVSLYNENPDAAIYPTPVIGMLGLIADYNKTLTQTFKQAGDHVYLLGREGSELGGSEYLKTIHNTIAGFPPRLDLSAEKKLHDLLLTLADKTLISSAHDVSDGGLLCAVAECCFSNSNLGMDLQFEISTRKSAVYFGEDQSRAVVSLPEENVEDFLKLAEQIGVPVCKLGIVTNSPVFNCNTDVSIAIGELIRPWQEAIKI